MSTEKTKDLISNTETMTFLDFFSGIGGFHSGLEKAGMKCIGWCEFDKFAQKSYNAMYDTEGLYFSDDIRKCNGKELPKSDLWAFGFPCQDISIAGNQRGIKEGTRSGLFFEVMRLLDEIENPDDKPKWLIAENVKNLLSIDKGHGFYTVLSEMAKRGTLANGKFTTQKTTDFHKTEKECTLLDIMETQVPEAYYLSQEKVNQLLTRLSLDIKEAEFTTPKE